MESNDLRIFKAVAQEGSITKAAETLGYVQSNVTARIQILEAELNTQLFYRQHGMILTPKGKKLLSYAEKILHLLNEAHKDLNNSAEPSGSLSIGANLTVSSLHLPKILSEYHKTYPVVDLSLLSGNADDLLSKVLHFEIDGAFISSSLLNNDKLVKELVFEEELVLISSNKINTIDSLFSRPFLMNTPGCPNRLQLESWLKSKGMTNIRFMEFNNLDAIIEGVISDLGASFVPYSSIKNLESQGVINLFKIPKKYGVSKTFFVRHRDTLITPAFLKFLDIITLKTDFHRT